VKTLLRILFSLSIFFTITAETAFATPDPDSISSLPTIHLVSPNGGEQWEGGGFENIEWVGTNLTENVVIEYSFDNGNSWVELGMTYSHDYGGTCLHQVPYNITQSARIRISPMFYPEVSDISDNVFSINSFESLYVNIFGIAYFQDILSVIALSRVNITFSEIQFPTNNYYNLYLSVDNGSSWNTIATNIQPVNIFGYSYLWDIPNTPSDSCKIKVEDATDPTRYGISPRFMILPVPQFSIVSVDPGEIIHTDSVFTIEFDKVDRIPYYIIAYSSDNGISWKTCGYAENKENHGKIKVQAPKDNIDSCLFRIVNYYYPAACDTTGYLKIRDYPHTPICQVTNDPSTKKNLVKWSKPQSTYISDYIIYRETDTTNQYNEVGRVNKNNPGEFVDVTSNSDQQAYRYCLSYIDQEGMIYPYSAPHQTIHLSAYKNSVKGYNLIWSPYEGADIQTYTIYRGVLANNMTAIATLSGNNISYTDLYPPTGTVFYQVLASGTGDCAGGDFSSGSNIVDESSLGISEEKGTELFAVYPNPAKDKIFITFSKPFSMISYSITDISGRILRSKIENMNSETKSEIDLSGIKNGVYFLQVKTDNFTATKKIVINQ
jgi:hypothetical protein